MAPQPEQTLAHYRLVERIGEGGMGVVWRAEDTSLQRPVALKFLTEESLTREDRRVRFLREARLAAALNHPSICTIYAVGEVQAGEEGALPSGEKLKPGTPFIAMEFIEGTSLAARMRAKVVLPLDKLLEVAVQVAEGLSAAHAREIVHRDLKPGNVMLTNDGRAKILDFGLAKPLGRIDLDDEAISKATTVSDELTREGMVVGTAAYMSPEQAQGLPLDARSDIFSFGIMLYEMVAGERPFKGRTRTTTRLKIIESEPEPLPAHITGMSTGLEQVIRRCLKKNPVDRYSDTRDLVAGLKELQDETVPSPKRPAASADNLRAEASPEEDGEGQGSWAARRLTLILTGVVVLIAIAVTLVVTLSLTGRSAREPRLARNSSSSGVHRQLTFTGTASTPEISPDGQFIAYLESGDEGEILKILDLSGGNSLEVFQASQISGFRWSPDGGRLLVPAASSASSNIDWGFYLVPRLGGAARRLSLEGFSPAAWSPDGTRLAHMGKELFQRKLWITEIETGESTAIPIEAAFRFLTALDWSPKGNLLLIGTVSDKGRNEIWTLPVEGDTQQRILDEPFLSPRWGSAGDRIYYMVAKEGPDELWKIGIDPVRGGRSSEPSSALTGLDGGNMSLSGDGSRLAFTKYTSRSNLWLIQTGNGTPGVEGAERQLTSGTASHGQPVISPDGARLAFIRNRDVFTMPVDGGSSQQLTFTGQCSNPAWSPDGGEIAFVSWKGDEIRIWTVPSRGGNPTPLPDSGVALPGKMTWAPSPQILFLRPGQRNFGVLDPETGEQRELVKESSMGFMCCRAVPSPDGKRVAITSQLETGDKNGIWIASLEDAALEFTREGEYALFGWSPDGAWLYALESEPPPPRIVRIPVGSGTQETLFKWRQESNLGGCTANPEGSAFVCSASQSSHDIWLVESFGQDVN